jgi:hypothetical protein
MPSRPSRLSGVALARKLDHEPYTVRRWLRGQRPFTRKHLSEALATIKDEADVLDLLQLMVTNEVNHHLRDVRRNASPSAYEINEIIELSIKSAYHGYMVSAYIYSIKTGESQPYSAGMWLESDITRMEDRFLRRFNPFRT